MDNKQTVTLLRQSKDNLVKAFEDAGVAFSGTAKAADFGGLITGLSGLRDVSIAVIRKSDGMKLYLNKDEYGSISTKVAVRGIRLRARGMSFIVALTDLGLNKTYALQDKYVSGIRTAKTRAAAFRDTDGLANTEEIRQAVEDGTITSDATAALDAYTAFDTSDYSEGDTATWYLPAAAQMAAIIRYADAITDMATAVSTNAASYAPSGFYWTSTTDTQYPYCITSYGAAAANRGRAVTTALKIRPICNE